MFIQYHFWMNGYVHFFWVNILKIFIFEKYCKYLILEMLVFKIFKYNISNLNSNTLFLKNLCKFFGTISLWEVSDVSFLNHWGACSQLDVFLWDISHWWMLHSIMNLRWNWIELLYSQFTDSELRQSSRTLPVAYSDQSARMKTSTLFRPFFKKFSYSWYINVNADYFSSLKTQSKPR